MRCTIWGRAPSSRSSRSTAALPETLLESELFGHERGAFTGAVKSKPGLLEMASGGTVFLDEVGDLPHPLQVKLLRFLQDQIVERIGGRQKIQVDVRIVSATNANLDDKISQGVFRGDLLYRMNALTVRVPPLRDRGNDVSLLASFFLGRFNQEFGRSIRGFTEPATAALNAHDWPGNVRELENRLKRAVVMTESRLIDAADLELAAPTDTPPDLDIRAARFRAEREVIQVALARSNNILSAAARLLGVSRPTLYGLMEVHGLAVEGGRSAEARVPGGEVLPGEAPRGEVPPGEAPGGEIANGQAPAGQLPPGQLSPGQAADSTVGAAATVSSTTG